MIDRRPYAALGGADHGWLKAKHHFSFARYYDPERLGHGAVRVWKHEEIGPPPPHADMEIITYVRSGAITHEDSLGNEGRTEAGDVQVMSAGSGVRHAEYNREAVPTTLFQIWIEPAGQGGTPSWGAKPFPKADRSGRLVPLASGFAGDTDALPIPSAARGLGATPKSGDSVEYAIGAKRHGYLVPAKGSVEVNGVRIEARDGAAISRESALKIKAIDDAEIILVDTG